MKAFLSTSLMQMSAVCLHFCNLFTLIEIIQMTAVYFHLYTKDSFLFTLFAFVYVYGSDVSCLMIQMTAMFTFILQRSAVCLHFDYKKSRQIEHFSIFGILN